MTDRRESLEQLRALPFLAAFRAATTHAPASWNSVTTGLAAIATMLLVHAWLLLSLDNQPSLLGVVLLPLGAALVVWGWVYWRLVASGGDAARHRRRVRRCGRAVLDHERVLTPSPPAAGTGRK